MTSLLLLLALVAAPFGSARAASFTVYNWTDSHDAAPGDGLCLDTNGRCSLRAAVEESNSLVGSDSIVVTNGTYGLFLGHIVIAGDLQIVGAGPNTVLDGRRKGRIFLIDDPGVTVTMSHLVMINGRTDEVGGIVWNKGHLTITDASLRSGKAARGAGIDSSGTLVLRRVGLARHTDAPPSGLGGALSNSGTATLESVSIVRSQARLGCGGGIYNTGTITATNLYVVRNRARLGIAGGICNSGGTFECTNCTIARNQANQLTGGIRNDGVMRLWNTVVADSFVHQGTLGRFNDPNCSGTPVVSRGNNAEDRDSCNLTQPSDSRGTRIRLRGPAPIPGTYLYASKPREDAILVDRGDDAVCPATDMLGQPRPFDGDDDGTAACDIGAAEYIP